MWISPRNRDSKEEIKRWTFDELVAAHELFEVLDEAENEERERTRERAAAQRERI